MYLSRITLSIYRNAKVVMNYLNSKVVETKNWPTQSPDMNQIENLWKTKFAEILRVRIGEMHSSD